MPADLRHCFAQRVQAPGARGTALTRAQMARLVGDLKKEGDRLSACGRRLVAWYEGLAAASTDTGARP